jgi:hypothetical protein
LLYCSAGADAPQLDYKAPLRAREAGEGPGRLQSVHLRGEVTGAIYATMHVEKEPP